MIYIYDILLNFTDNKRLVEFYEWNDQDIVEHIKKIPLYRVKTSFIDKVIKNEIKVNKDFLNEIKNLTELFQNKTNIKYAVLISDLSKVIALEFDENGRVICKSTLLIDEEEEVLDVCDNLDVVNIDYSIVKKLEEDYFLTRREMYIKNYLLKELNSSYKKKQYEKINYLYEECFNNKEGTDKDKYEFLKEDINNNFSKIHIDLFNILTLKELKK